MPEAQHLPGDREEFINSETGEFMFVGVLDASGTKWDIDPEATEAKRAVLVEMAATRNVAILDKLEALVTSHGFFNLEGFSLDCADEHLAKTEDERLIALWNAIVAADKSL